ncbi:MAG: NAD(P)(+) transhydrogenase (Re/Si-specific) subunit beta, partial [Micrococcales bacterium]|nr:NAD(P)(+) transhydrogenase (Re/Si-specific) subunit beta [Micrococcales bacterium]
MSAAPVLLHSSASASAASASVAASVAGAAYLVAALLFILSLHGLSKHETARRGVRLWRARVVEMTGMPELIALLHSFVGLAAVIVGWNGALDPGEIDGALLGIHHAEVFIGVFIGAVTFTGSIVAFLKLSARISSKPLMLPGKNVLNLGALVAFVGLTVWYVITPDLWLLIVVTVLALLLGWHLVASIGGGDMPVVVSMLNSYSGWAAAAAGFILSNDLLIVTGALVGSSGAYLSYIMC